MDPAPSPSESSPGTRSSPSPASRPARLRTPSLAACVAAADRRVRAQAALPQPSGSHFHTCWSLHLLLWRSHETVPEPFSYPASKFLHTQDQDQPCLHKRSTHPTGTATEVRPLTSSPSSRGQSSREPCGELPTPLVDGQTSWLYPYQPCTVPVYKLLRKH